MLLVRAPQELPSKPPCRICMDDVEEVDYEEPNTESAYPAEGADYEEPIRDS